MAAAFAPAQTHLIACTKYGALVLGITRTPGFRATTDIARLCSQACAPMTLVRVYDEIQRTEDGQCVSAMQDVGAVQTVFTTRAGVAVLK